MTKEQWIKHLESREYLMDHWDSEDSFEIYTTSPMDKAIGDVKEWDEKYKDECGSLWCLHLYAYIQKDRTVEYDAFLYTDVEKGDSEHYDGLHIPAELKEALDYMVLKERFGGQND